MQLNIDELMKHITVTLLNIDELTKHIDETPLNIDELTANLKIISEMLLSINELMKTSVSKHCLTSMKSIAERPLNINESMKTLDESLTTDVGL